MLQQMKLTITTLSPVVLSAKSSSTLTHSSEAFGGSVIRGTLADIYAQNTGVSDEAHLREDFRRLFFRDIAYLPANPLVNGDRSFPLPLSLQKAKQNGNILDLLTDEPQPNYKKIIGYGVTRGHDLYKAKTETRLSLHMSRNGEKERLLGQSKDGGIYNLEAIGSGQTFQGLIIGEESALRELVAGLRPQNGEIVARMGRSRHTEYGKCRLQFAEPEDIAPEDIPAAGSGSIYLRLETDLIPNENFIAAADILNETILMPLIDVLGQGLTLGQIFAGSDKANNFSGIWGMRRPEEKIISMGSVLEIKKDGGWTGSDIQTLSEHLPVGFGQRICEGFGQLRFWSPHSLVLVESLPLKLTASPALSPNTKALAKEIIIGKIAEQIRLYAHDDAEKIKGQGTAHFWSRMEGILDKANSRQTMQELLDSEKRDKDGTTFVDHLTAIRVNGHTLDGILVNGESLPYMGKKWQNDMCRDTQVSEKFAALLAVLDLDQSVIDKRLGDGAAFVAYWREFFQHARKMAKGGTKNG